MRGAGGAAGGRAGAALLTRLPVQVFRGMLRWGRAHRGRRSLKAAVARLVPHVRYALMSPDDLARHVKPAGVVPAEYMEEAYEHHLEAAGLKVRLLAPCIVSAH